jgi:sarcosine oxidase
MTTADVIVVGLGAVGSAVAHHLALGGAQVIGLDRFAPPHDQGSSHGATRITRLAIGEGEEYVPIVQRSHALWRALEAQTGETLMTTTGGLLIASAGSDGRTYHGQSGFFERTVAAAERFSIVHERLDAAETRHRFPAFMPRDDERAYWERDAGILYPERCVAAQLQAARSRGADLRYGCVVERIESLPGAAGVTVVTNIGRLSAAQVVIAAGAWLPTLLSSVQAARFTVQRQVLHWFAANEPALFAPGLCPVFIWIHGDDGASFYGFPQADGIDGVKVAGEQTVHATTADSIDRVVTGTETALTFEAHIRGRLRSVTPRSVHDATCLYTSTTDGRFVIDRHPECPNVTVVSACSGHGFKHSAAVGESVADTILGQAPHVDLSSFATLRT